MGRSPPPALAPPESLFPVEMIRSDCGPLRNRRPIAAVDQGRGSYVRAEANRFSSHRPDHKIGPSDAAVNS